MPIMQGDKKVANVYNINNNSYSMPIGCIIPFSGSTIPVGFLLCDGSEISKTDYADLYVVIGNKFGTATDTTKFKLPDLRGKFIQGANGNLGASKDAGLPNVTGQVGYLKAIDDGNYNESINLRDGCFLNSKNMTTTPPTQSVHYGSQDTTNRTGTIVFDASKSNSIYGNSDTVQPPSVCLSFIIKAEKVSDQYAAGVSALIDDTSVNSSKVWSSEKVNEECVKVHKKNTSVTTAVYQWFVARYDSQTKMISTTIPITIADDVSNVSLSFGDHGILLHTGSGEIEKIPTQINTIGIEDAKSLGLLRFDMKVDSDDTSINCIAIPSGTTITFS